MNNVNMNVKVNASVYASSTVAQHHSTTVKEAGKETTTSSTQIKQDTFVSSASISASKNNATEENKNVTYEKPNKLSAQQLQALPDQRVASFKNMVQTMLGKQVKTLNKSLFEGISISAADKQAAIDAISPGGAWSPENVAGNILNMAKALSGGDASKIETLKNAVIKGFQAAEKEWGGKLPCITDETYDLIMKGFDEWANEGKETDNVADDTTKTEKAEA